MSFQQNQEVDREQMPQGRIRLFIGKGQGKSWAALGIAFKAMAWGMKVHVVQFLKSGITSEPLSRLEKQLPLFKIDTFGQHCPFVDLLKNGLINCRDCKKCHVSAKNVRNMDMEFAELAFELAWGVMENGSYQLLVLDEVLKALELGLFTVDELARLLDARPSSLEIVLTGPDAPPEILKRARDVTYFMAVKKPLPGEISPRWGIDY